MTLATRLRNSFIAGLFLVAPLAVTLFVLQFVFDWVTTTIRPVVRQVQPFLATTLNYSGDLVLVAQVLSALLIALTITFVGYLASKSVGQQLFGGFERGIRLIPLVRTIYFGVRQVSESLTESTESYDRVVLVEYPRERHWMLGFVTNGSPKSVNRATDEELYTVFIPHSPNPTVGKLMMVPEEEMWELDMSVRRGFRIIVTTGLSADDIEDDLPAGVIDDASLATQR
ncbi:DUF502 domain-containing protein [Salinigranum salinum]|uniref:DUF502 domain-containing protein n=1 Tax=Salinigranum salinum TaxID=1364937 RepID=UPI001260B1DE|nr:DUF502 domain-containing protein [Salinigranum salinum]